ncbi:MAG: hypothetical protein RLZZ247_944 [Cyanobacteriota bacterium]|jgi:uncharacterized integral membrane protein
MTSFEGVYGPFTITAEDEREVFGYRLALCIAAIAQAGLLLQWRQWGSGWLWPWLLPLVVGVGLALHWIHIYLRPLHQVLQLFWLLGSVGFVALALSAGPAGMADAVTRQPAWLWAIGPFFAALAGIGFKEFFCFRRPEAIGVTLLLPVALLGALSGLLPVAVSGALMGVEASLLLVLTLRKFPMPAAADVGDKSVFAYLEAQRKQPST